MPWSLISTTASMSFMAASNCRCSTPATTSAVFLPIHVHDTERARPVAVILRPGKTPSGV